MTPAQAKELLPVHAAYAEGKVVQWRYTDDPNWRDFSGDDYNKSEPYLCATICFNVDVEWRVKPEPREWWLCPACLQSFNYPEREHRGTFQCGRCSVNVVHVREVLP